LNAPAGPFWQIFTKEFWGIAPKSKLHYLLFMRLYLTTTEQFIMNQCDDPRMRAQNIARLSQTITPKRLIATVERLVIEMGRTRELTDLEERIMANTTAQGTWM
jgi:hypothetical protein